MAKVNTAMVSDHALAAWINAAVKNGIEDTANDLSDFITHNRMNGWLDEDTDNELVLILNGLLLAKLYQDTSEFIRDRRHIAKR